MDLLGAARERRCDSGGQAMHPFYINPQWYETYWYHQRSGQKRRAPLRVSRVLVCILAIAAGAAALIEQSGIADAPKLGHVHIRI